MIDVKDFGAVGDGITDDRAAIQAALDAGGWVYIPEGTYALTSGVLRIRPRTRLTLAQRAMILRRQTGGLLTNEQETQPGGYAGAGGIVIEGGFWNINAGEIRDYAVGLGICHCVDATVRDAVFIDTTGWHAIEVNSSSDVLIDNCSFRGFYDGGDRNFSEAIQIDAAIDASTGYPPFDGTVCDDVEIRSCWAGASGTPGTQAWPRFVGTHSVPQTWHRNIRIHDNEIVGATWAAIRAYWWDRAIITGNQIVSSEGEGIAVQYSSRYVEVHGNQIFDAAKNGILISDDCTQINVRDNDVIGSGRGANNTYDGIRVSGSSIVRLANNTVRKRASGNSARYGLRIESSASGIQRYGNDLRYGGVSGNLYDASPSPITLASDAT
jgi:polygalacturonase